MKKICFVTGSQELYGDGTHKQAAKDSMEISDYLHEMLDTITKIRR